MTRWLLYALIVLMLVLALSLLGCAQPGDINARGAGSLPNCIISCNVTIATTDGNRGDGLTTTLGSSTTTSRSTAVSETESP